MGKLFHFFYFCKYLWEFHAVMHSLRVNFSFESNQFVFLRSTSVRFIRNIVSRLDHFLHLYKQVILPRGGRRGDYNWTSLQTGSSQINHKHSFAKIKVVCPCSHRVMKKNLDRKLKVVERVKIALTDEQFDIWFAF